MSHLDKSTGQVVVRIVYDGPPGAGKTTNLQQLCDAMAMHRRGDLVSPMTDGRRTEFFDWVDFGGGVVDNRPVRCQLVSVPGQTTLLRRRRYLLESADAVVFVADSCATSVDANRRALETLHASAKPHDGLPPVGIVFQANKQDAPDALNAHELALELGAADVPVIPAAAASGKGVAQTFLMAVRLATDRVRALLLSGALGEVAASPDSPEELYAAILSAETSAAHNASLEEFYDPAPNPLADLGAEVEEIADQPVFAEAEQRLIPWAPDVRAGHLWPPVTGRAVLAAVNRSVTTQSREIQAWAPAGASEIRSDLGWILHTTEEWTFPDSDEGSAAELLRTTVSKWLRMRDTIPEGRSLILSRDDGRWRMWMISPQVRTLSVVLRTALEGEDVEGLIGVLTDIATVVAESRAAPEHEATLKRQSLDTLAFSPQKRIWCMDPMGSSPRSAPPGGSLFAEIREEVLTRYRENGRVAPLVRDAREVVASHPDLGGIIDEMFSSS
jgi:signal recognition particle receptor subunit beta